jgi:type I restriction enzyme S subunit
MIRFKKYKLGELVTFQRGHDLTVSNIVQGKYPVAGSNGPIGYHNEFTTKGPSLTLGRSGNSIGVAHYYKNDFWAHNTTLYAKEFHNSHPKFIFYLLKALDFNSHNSGSAVPSLNRNFINPLEVEAPDLPTQTCIASILSSLDDKIELNRRTNYTLEQIAQTLFKKYFVDDIHWDNLPNHLEIKQLGYIADVIDCLHSKKPEIEDVDTGNVFLQLENILDNGLLEMSKRFTVSNEDYKKWVSRIEVQFGDCIITNVGRSGVAARIPSGIKAAMGRNMTAIRLKEQYKCPAFLITLLTSDYMKREIESNLDVGTILNALNVRSIPKLKLLFPKSENMVLEIEKHLSPLILLMEENLNGISKLSRVRDLLLPKLMSGEIEVNGTGKELVTL